MKTFDQKANLEKFLQDRENPYGPNRRINIIGKSLIHRHCGERMLKIQKTYTEEEGTKLKIKKANGNEFYCISCGYNFSNLNVPAAFD